VDAGRVRHDGLDSIGNAPEAGLDPQA